MNSILSGWRRKAGLLALVLSCIGAAGWIRSGHVQDCFTAPSGSNNVIQIFSANGYVILAKVDFDFQQPTLKPQRQVWSSRPVEEHGWRFEAENNILVFYGFHAAHFWYAFDIHRRGMTTVMVTRLQLP